MKKMIDRIFTNGLDDGEDDKGAIVELKNKKQKIVHGNDLISITYLTTRDRLVTANFLHPSPPMRSSFFSVQSVRLAVWADPSKKTKKSKKKKKLVKKNSHCLGIKKDDLI